MKKTVQQHFKHRGPQRKTIYTWWEKKSIFKHWQTTINTLVPQTTNIKTCTEKFIPKSPNAIERNSPSALLFKSNRDSDDGKPPVQFDSSSFFPFYSFPFASLHARTLARWFPPNQFQNTKSSCILVLFYYSFFKYNF